MAVSNKFGALVLTTGNKSECAVGYCTLYGDTNGGFAPICDLYKTEVYRISNLVNREAGREIIPQNTIDKPPSAELRPDQKDEDSLPPYDILDAILRMYVEEVVSRYREDDRVLIWEAWNEPGTAATMEDIVSELLPKTIQWIRGQAPVQPVTVGVHSPDLAHAGFGQIALSMSDINSFHSYSPWEDLYTDAGAPLVGMKHIALEILAYGRPVICSEYMARGGNYKATFQNTLPYMKTYRIGAINWGLVWGKTNTVYPWESVAGDPEPEYWFHDILYPDGTPKYPDEVEYLRNIIGGTGDGE